MVEQQHKVWHVSRGSKEHGPMSARRVRRYLRDGKLTPTNLAWREGQGDWAPLVEIPEFAAAIQTVVDLAPPEDADPEPTSETAAEPAAAAEAAPFEPPHRIERRDVWRAFGLGAHRSRVQLALGLLVAWAAVASGVALAAALHWLLGAAAALAAAVALPMLALTGAGALTYQTRCAIGEQRTPSPTEALRFVRRNLLALGGVPLLISVGAAVPLVALAAISLLVKIPYVGPVGTGLTFGLHLALSAATLFLALSGALSWVLAPVVVGFEETGVLATARLLLDLVRRSTVRLTLWATWPQLAFGGLTLGLTALWAAVLAAPVALALTLAGGAAALPSLALPGPLAPGLAAEASPLGDEPGFESSEFESPAGEGFAGPGDEPLASGPELVPGSLLGALPAGLWIGLSALLVAAVLLSVQNAIVSLLYLGCRAGNDELISRDTYLAQQRAQVQS